MIPSNVMAVINRFIPNIDVSNIKSPDDMAQYLLNTGRVNQQHVNQAKQMWSNPQIQQQINTQYK